MEVAAQTGATRIPEKGIQKRKSVWTDRCTYFGCHVRGDRTNGGTGPGWNSSERAEEGARVSQTEVTSELELYLYLINVISFRS